jgi:hypothetical protein
MQAATVSLRIGIGRVIVHMILTAVSPRIGMAKLIVHMHWATVSL